MFLRLTLLFLTIASLHSAPVFAGSGKTDYYQVLEVSPEATTDEIKSAYRKKAKLYHPDLHPGDKVAEEKFKQVAEAWEVLQNEDKRYRYDHVGSASFTSNSHYSVPVTPPQGDKFAKPERVDARGEVNSEPARITHWNTGNPNTDEAYQIAARVRGRNVVGDESYIRKFQTPEQVEALRAIADARGNSIWYVDYEAALKIQTREEVEVLKAVALAKGKNVNSEYSNIAKFTTEYQREALITAAAQRGWNLNYDYGELLKFQSKSQVDALKIVSRYRGSSLNFDYSKLLKFDSPEKVEVLKRVTEMLGPTVHYQYSDLLKFETEIQRKALFLDCEISKGSMNYNLHRLVQFKNIHQLNSMINAKEKMGSEVRFNYAQLSKFDDAELEKLLENQLNLTGSHTSLQKLYKSELARHEAVIKPALNFTNPEALSAQLKKPFRRRIEAEALASVLNENMDALLKGPHTEETLASLAAASGNEVEELTQKHEVILFDERLKTVKSEIKSFPEFEKAIVGKNAPEHLVPSLTGFLNNEGEWIAALPGFNEKGLALIDPYLQSEKTSAYLDALLKGKSQKEILELSLKLSKVDERYPQLILDSRIEKVLAMGPLPKDLTEALLQNPKIKTSLKASLAQDLVSQCTSREELQALKIPESVFQDKAFAAAYKSKSRSYSRVIQCLSRFF